MIFAYVFLEKINPSIGGKYSNTKWQTLKKYIVFFSNDISGHYLKTESFIL